MNFLERFVIDGVYPKYCTKAVVRMIRENKTSRSANA